MKVLLVNPTGGPESDYGALSKAGSEMPQLGLAAIATSLSKEGHVVRIIDSHVHKITEERLLGIILEEKYDVVGFSVYITSAQKTLHLAETIKARVPDVLVMVGGPQVTLSPGDFQKACVDYIFIGEADYSLATLLKGLERGEKNPDIPGVLYREGPLFKGQMTLNLVEDLDELPLIDLERFYDMAKFYPAVYQPGRRVVNLVGGRGCPFQCSFCAAAQVNGRRVRNLSIERFLEYVSLYRDRGYDSFMFYDDTFTFNRKRVIGICEAIIRKKWKMRWNCWSRVDCMDAEMLAYMKAAGCHSIVFGCESMNDRTLKLLKKGFTAEQSLAGIEMVKKAGLLAVSSFMIGLPGETKDDIENTIRTVNKTHLDIAVYPIFEPYKGTPIYDICRETGSWVKNEQYRNTLLVESQEVWVPHGISRAEIEHLARYAFRSFYFRPYFLVSAFKMLAAIPLGRKMRFLSSGVDYFLLSRWRKASPDYEAGSRYR